ncbi:3-oxoacyl-[acyl-carrier-protein] synthase-3 [Pseudomonas frederiksbergensis]|uniref:beta-ketoacyl-ACP synthase III n=1 Tax=Pseudomonas frederiksbergensis TaxID=104087 RepID=UPI003D1E0A5D
MGVRIAGLGGALPPLEVTNEDLEKRLDTTSEWIVSRTGILKRYAVTEGISTSDLAYEAAQAAIENASGSSRIDMLILATTTPDRRCPATAPKVAEKLGLRGISAFDVNAVCSGFIYALQIGTASIKAGFAKRVLVIGADVFSTIINKEDRSTVPIFGDGAGAIILEESEFNEVQDIETGSDGSLEELITIRAGGVESKVNAGAGHPDDLYFSMSGKEVFSRAIKCMNDSVIGLLERNKLRIQDIDCLVPHQANLRIIRTLAEQLGVPYERAAVSLDKFGNTSAASIPLALTQACIDYTLKRHDRVVLTAFGGGVTWGSALLSWPELNSVPFIKKMSAIEVTQ